MQSFKYTALDRAGNKTDGMIEAFDELDATAKIRDQFGTVIKLQEIKTRSVPHILQIDLNGHRVNSKAFTMMCNQFSTIIDAGIPVARAVRLIADKTADKNLKRLLKWVGDDVEAGRSVSASFETHGGSFLPPTFVETLRAGEESGSLANAFDSVYRHYDKQMKMSDKVRNAMMYPLFVLAVAVVVVIVLMTKVVPTFLSIFEEQGQDLPLMTKMLIAISTFVQHTFLIFLFLVVIGGIALILWRRTLKGRLALSKFQLKLPVLGNIAELNAASLFANTMATMIGSGLPMTKSVSITSEVMDNEVVKQATAGMVSKIEEGRTVVDSMREAECYPDILVDMVGVGEETGEMKRTLDTISRYYDDELELAITRAIAMLEPALLIFIAIVAGFIVISIYVSMFAMYQGM